MNEVMDCRSVSVKDAVGQHWLAIGSKRSGAIGRPQRSEKL